MDLNKLIDSMSIDQKIGQLSMVLGNLFTGDHSKITGPAAEAGYNEEQYQSLGSVLNFSSLEQAMEIQKNHLDTDPNKIPILFCMDIIHGYRTIFPIPLAMACSFDEKLFEECIKMSAKEASANGVHLTFSPMVDFVRDPRWGRIIETGGEDVLVNKRMAAAQVRGFQGNDLKDSNHIATCTKHFAGYGGAEAGRDYNTVELSDNQLYEYYLPAYKACLDAGSVSVMMSFNTLNGVPATVNPRLKHILRDEWNFSGVVMSDYSGVHETIVHGVCKDEKEAAEKSLKNECDIEMVSSAYAKHLKELISEGIISEKLLNQSVLRVLKLKDSLGLFENPFRGATVEAAKASILTKENRALARKAAEQTSVLLKNNGVLPFHKNVKKVAVIGPLANEKTIMSKWAITGKFEDTVTVAEGVRNLLPDAEVQVAYGCSNLWKDTNESGFDEAIKLAKESDVVILCIGEPNYYTAEGNSRTSLKIPGVQEKLAEKIIAVNQKTAVLMFTGRPLELNRLNEIAPAILYMWLPGVEGGNAAANLLFGNANPSAKITMSFPRYVGQCPIYYNRLNTGRPKSGDDNEFYPYCSNYIDSPNSPLFNFGYGLSYSKFEYGALSLSSDKLSKDGVIEATVTVTNASEVDGYEVVQLYMHDLVASKARPIQQLLDYKKVFIKAGATEQVVFHIDESMLRFYHDGIGYCSEAGEFDLMVGYADHFTDVKRFELTD